ncbi:Hypothetical protein RG1141_CH25220 [Neorhizobium galegae bv. officinalis bv. officinalis str. HAMBI 1141]|uniref:Uncharacterized protein n=1 Tax=Neorhizobium galegae bv. officinalis bv. officinalis str. HAMBI 1141 TaxID=1028801 RepID=A0A068T9T4_NEOGA|nr:hypothetical protein [Neorhizobium galegae]CDN54859.1 Hypothetical protein RG1141_CH25220 [Neorhizobium galegae bv. officinalis bv. officinalis str. HAMBI 1141]
MATLRQILDKAAAAGLIAASQVRGLEAHLAQHGVRADIAVPEPQGVIESDIVDTEVPRFIRGFHDVLITIGVLIVMAGIWGIGSVLALLPLIIVLAEILVVRQRLALPAVVLSLATVVWTVFTTMAVLDGLDIHPTGVGSILLVLLPLPAVMGLFYWRYRIPIALAALLLSAFALALTVVIYLLGRASGTGDFVESFPLLSSAIFFLSAVGLFSVAMGYDLSDPLRVTRRSDIAFWIHLAAAPALLYAMLSFVFLRKGTGLLSPDRFGAYDSAGQVLVIVILLMTIGLIIDRRAFVTSGLVSLIAAVVSILAKGDLGGGSAVFVALLVVGSVVLVIGVGWPQLRRLAVGILPDTLKTKLPPLR